MNSTPQIVDCDTDAQLRRVAEIYAHHVRHGTGTFEIDPPTDEEMSRRRADVRTCGLPFLVAQVDGHVVGFAYAAPFRPRPAFRFTAEDSVYVDPAWLGRGVGKSLLAEVLQRAAQIGIRQMLALVGDSGNLASLRLHESLGFQRAGLLEKTGYKFERWLDVVLLQRSLLTHGAPV